MEKRASLGKKRQTRSAVEETPSPSPSLHCTHSTSVQTSWLMKSLYIARIVVLGKCLLSHFEPVFSPFAMIFQHSGRRIHVNFSPGLEWQPAAADTPNPYTQSCADGSGHNIFPTYHPNCSVPVSVYWKIHDSIVDWCDIVPSYDEPWPVGLELIHFSEYVNIHNNICLHRLTSQLSGILCVFWLTSAALSTQYKSTLELNCVSHVYHDFSCGKFASPFENPNSSDSCPSQIRSMWILQIHFSHFSSFGSVCTIYRFSDIDGPHFSHSHRLLLCPLCTRHHQQQAWQWNMALHRRQSRISCPTFCYSDTSASGLGLAGP
jgi:hypothetical protein